MLLGVRFLFNNIIPAFTRDTFQTIEMSFIPSRVGDFSTFPSYRHIPGQIVHRQSFVIVLLDAATATHHHHIARHVNVRLLLLLLKRPHQITARLVQMMVLLQRAAAAAAPFVRLLRPVAAAGSAHAVHMRGRRRRRWRRRRRQQLQLSCTCGAATALRAPLLLARLGPIEVDATAAAAAKARTAQRHRRHGTAGTGRMMVHHCVVAVVRQLLRLLLRLLLMMVVMVMMRIVRVVVQRIQCGRLMVDVPFAGLLLDVGAGGEQLVRFRVVDAAAEQLLWIGKTKRNMNKEYPQ